MLIKHSLYCQLHIKILHLWCTTLENKITFWKKWPSCLRVNGKILRGPSAMPFVMNPGPRLNIKTVLSTYGDFHVKDKTAVGRLIFNMGIAIPSKTVFLIETAPSTLLSVTFLWTTLQSKQSVNRFRPRQNGCHFADGIFKLIFLNENFHTWSAPSHYLNLTLTILLMHMFVTWPPWVKTHWPQTNGSDLADNFKCTEWEYFWFRIYLR